MRYEFVQVLAESFSGVTGIESACYHYLYNTDSKARHAYYQTLYDYLYQQTLAVRRIDTDHLDRIVRAVLHELTFPVAHDGYAWTIKDRCLQAQFNRRTWYRRKYNELACAMIDSVRTMSDRVELLTSHQIKDYYRSSASA